MKRDIQSIQLDIERISETLYVLYKELAEAWWNPQMKVIVVYQYKDKHWYRWEWSCPIRSRSYDDILSFINMKEEEWYTLYVTNIIDLI